MLGWPRSRGDFRCQVGTSKNTSWDDERLGWVMKTWGDVTCFCCFFRDAGMLGVFFCYIFLEDVFKKCFEETERQESNQWKLEVLSAFFAKKQDSA